MQVKCLAQHRVQGTCLRNVLSLTIVIDSELATSGQGLLKLGCDDFLKPGSPTGGKGRSLGPLWAYCKVKEKGKKERRYERD